MIHAGIIGAGYWGPNLIRTLRTIENVKVTNVADLRPGRREFIERQFPGVVTVDSHHHVIESDVDAVLIASPPETHAELAMRALEAGKHVFVEKPMTTNVADAEKMVRAAERCARMIAVGHLFLFHPAVTTIRKLLDLGELGDIYFLSSTRANLGPPNPNSDVVWDLAPHDISILLYLFHESPYEITGRGASFTIPNLAETAYINLGFPSGRIAQINVSWLVPHKTRRLELVCSKKTVVYDDTHPTHKLQIYDTAADNRTSAKDYDAIPLAYGPGSVWSPALPNCEPLRLECEHFFKCIETGSDLINSGKNALDVVRILECASESIQSSMQYRDACISTAVGRL